MMDGWCVGNKGVTWSLHFYAIMICSVCLITQLHCHGRYFTVGELPLFWYLFDHGLWVVRLFGGHFYTQVVSECRDRIYQH